MAAARMLHMSFGMGSERPLRRGVGAHRREYGVRNGLPFYDIVNGKYVVASTARQKFVRGLN